MASMDWKRVVPAPGTHAAGLPCLLVTSVGRMTMAYMTAVPMGLCYVSRFAAVRRLASGSVNINGVDMTARLPHRQSFDIQLTENSCDLLGRPA